MECITTATRAQTRIHVDPVEGGDFLVWLDTDDGERNGVPIGFGATRLDALLSAMEELLDRMEECRVATASPSYSHP